MSKKTAVIMNVGRGPVINESALVNALEENRSESGVGRLRQGAITGGHPFWTMKKCSFADCATTLKVG